MIRLLKINSFIDTFYHLSRLAAANDFEADTALVNAKQFVQNPESLKLLDDIFVAYSNVDTMPEPENNEDLVRFFEEYQDLKEFVGKIEQLENQNPEIEQIRYFTHNVASDAGEIINDIKESNYTIDISDQFLNMENLQKENIEQQFTQVGISKKQRLLEWYRKSMGRDPVTDEQVGPPKMVPTNPELFKTIKKQMRQKARALGKKPISNMADAAEAIEWALVEYEKQGGEFISFAESHRRRERARRQKMTEEEKEKEKIHLKNIHKNKSPEKQKQQIKNWKQRRKEQLKKMHEQSLLSNK